MDFAPVEVPVSEVTAKGDVIKIATAANELFYEAKPGLRVLFPFGAMIGCCHPGSRLFARPFNA
jgi:hypothetical protein